MRTPGTYTITVTATDQGGTTSAPVTTTATILPYEVQGSTLAIGGTTGSNSFVTAPGANAGSLTARLNGATIGTFQASAVAIYGGGGMSQVMIDGVQNYTNTFTLSGSTATFAAASHVFTYRALNNISRVLFQGGNSGNSFTNTGATVASVLVGGWGTNTYTIGGTQMGAATLIHGIGSANTLYGPTLAAGAANVWTIMGANAGTLNGASCSFTGVQNLVGGAGADSFTIGNGGSLSGIMDGGTGANTLTSPNLANVLNITSKNAGTLRSSSGVDRFTSIQNLIGGTLSNNFVFSPGAGVSGTIAGHGVSRLDYSAYGSAVYVNLVTGMASGTSGVSQIMQIRGSGDNDVLVGNGNGELLSETAGDNLMIAGTGSRTTLDGGSGADLVIAGSTIYDNNQAALQAIEEFWATDVGSSFASTVAALSAGIAGGYKLRSTTVQHLGTGDTVDLISAKDWLFCRMLGNTKDSLIGIPKESSFI